MRIDLHIQSGDSEGHRRWLIDGQSLTVGSSYDADLVLEDDAALAPRHFSLKNLGDGCVVRDLGSPVGTCVDGEFVHETMLVEDAEITAGETRFFVELHGMTKKAEVGSDSIRIDSLRNLTGEERSWFLCEESDDASKRFIQWRHAADDSSADLKPSKLFVSLRDHLSATAILHYQKLGMAPPAEESLSWPLLSNLPEKIARRAGPWVIAGERTDWHNLVDDAWDQDALQLWFHEDGQTEAVKDHLSALIATPTAPGEPSMAGCCWPSVMANRLLEADETQLDRWLGPCAGVLVEDPTSAGGWCLFARRSARQVLKDAGFAPSTKSVPQDPSDPTGRGSLPPWRRNAAVAV